MLPKCLQACAWTIERPVVCFAPRSAQVLLPIVVLIVVRIEHLILGLVHDVSAEQFRSNFDRRRSGGTTSEEGGGKGEDDVFHKMGVCRVQMIARRFNYGKLSSVIYPLCPVSCPLPYRSPLHLRTFVF